MNVSGGTLQVNVDGNLGDPSNAITFDGGGALRGSSSGSFTATARNFIAAAGGGGVDTNGTDLTHTGTITGPGTFFKYGAGNLTVNNVRSGGLFVSGGKVTVAAGRSTAHTSLVNTLAVGPGNTLDLNDNDLAINYSGTSPLPTVQAGIASGYNGGSWSGTGITSSAAAAQAGSAHKTALGYGEASAVFSSFPASFSGQSVDNTSVLVRYTYAGDANLDGTVDTLDFNALAGNFGGTGKVWTQADFNYDGVVDTLDFNNLAANFGQQLSTQAGAGALVPEPATAAFAACGFEALVTAHRRKRAR